MVWLQSKVDRVSACAVHGQHRDGFKVDKDTLQSQYESKRRRMNYSSITSTFLLVIATIISAAQAYCSRSHIDSIPTQQRRRGAFARYSNIRNIQSASISTNAAFQYPHQSSTPSPCLIPHTNQRYNKGSSFTSQTYLCMSQNNDDNNNDDNINDDDEDSSINDSNEFIINQESSNDDNQSMNPSDTNESPSISQQLQEQQIKQLQEFQDTLLRRITQLEALTASQTVEIRKLKEESQTLQETASTFAQVIDLLRQAGLPTDETSSSSTSKNNDSPKKKQIQSTSKSSNSNVSSSTTSDKENQPKYESYNDSEIFGTAPSSVTDAADAAGASILAALLAGKQRMLLDVRDAELSRDAELLVQFIELAILPVAAGLEGLDMAKNRVKVVFPTVSQLLEYRRTMALAAPEVVALSTLGFDPVEEQDNLVVIIAPSPDNEECWTQLNDLLEVGRITQPVVILNHYMVPPQGPCADFTPVYHLRLLSVQYRTNSESPPLEWEQKVQKMNSMMDDIVNTTADIDSSSTTETPAASNNNDNSDETVDDSNTDTTMTNRESNDDNEEEEEDDDALKAAMEHAHEIGTHRGITRAMVIRAYPMPWHVFVDTSPSTDADFEVAGTFDEPPSQDDVNYAIVECLEGSEREEELVAQQMQQALEAGQLKSFKGMVGLPNIDIDMNTTPLGNDEGKDEVKDDGDDSGDFDDDDDDFYNDWDQWDTDTV